MSRRTTTRIAVALAAAWILGCKDDTPHVRTAQSPSAADNGQSLNDARLARAESAANIKTIGQIETVATFTGPMPTGVTVSRGGRTFVCFPRWADAVEFTVAEIKDGRAVPYPDLETNR